jgi:hypothetical protein
MIAYQKAKVSPKIVAKARKVLKFVQKRAKEVWTQSQLSEALYAREGIFCEMFPTANERRAFFRTSEYEEIVNLIISLPRIAVVQVYDDKIPPLDFGTKQITASRRA